MRKPKLPFHVVYIFLTLTLMICGIRGQFTCNQPGNDEVIRWRDGSVNHTVPWRLDQVCSGTLQCYGFEPETGEVAQDVQLCPIQMQFRDTLFLLPPPANSPYTTTVVNVSEAEFYSCPPSKAYPANQILQNADPTKWLRVPDRFLKPGILYLAQHPDGAFSNCNFGLRIKILIKDMICRASPTQAHCSGRGTCGSQLFEENYRCYCFENYRGPFCDEYDACASSPCVNGANCVDGDEGLLGSNFFCVCNAGFTGADCAEILGQCTTGICGNGSCIAVSPIAFKCQCRQGFSGSYCQHFVDMCTPDPCLHGASCRSHHQGFSCHCPAGFTGSRCEVNIDECASSPCASGATCVDDVNSFYCRCPPGFSSGLCIEPINYCASNPCENRGECLPVLNGFYCNCSFGFTGYQCQQVVTECNQVSQICQNGGHCLQSPGGPVQCQCSPGWTGPTCHRLDNLCRFNPCPNGTYCVDTSSVLRPGTYHCACPPGYTGSSCQTEIHECSSNPCKNGGECLDRLASYVCKCPEGYTGSNCETNIDMCKGRAQLLCQNNGTCVDGDLAFTYYCICRPGFTSADCSVNIQECQSSPCLNNGTCVDGINTYSCVCPYPFYGPNCASFFDYCTLNPCGRGASCIPLVGSYRCICPSGYTGTNCTQDVNECLSNPCRSGATCQNLPNAFRCECSSGYTGRLCEVNINDCFPGACLNGATCIDQVNGYQCDCQQGFADANCGREIIECLSAPCQNGGVCSDEINGYNCFCDNRLWGGSNCEIALNNCSYSPCRNGATCEPLSHRDFRCICPNRYTGTLCESYLTLCQSSPCLNSGTCSENLENNSYDCLCSFAYFGDRCENNRDFCESHSCKNGATCIDGTQDYTCICQTGYQGRFCEVDVDDCASTPCKNEALCQDKVNGYQCFCVNGFVGSQCTEDLNECMSSPCLNGAQCLNGRDRFVCECAVGFTGTRCGINIDDCYDHKCANGASCVDEIGGYTCRCRSGFVGADCAFEINECLSSPCSPVGTLVCSDTVANYTCVCKTGYRGRHCEIEIDECSSNPCLNQATCINLVNGFRCICPDGTTGTFCEITVSECSSNPCGSGRCSESANGYICTCPSDGILYDRNCRPIQPCISGPCFNKGVCINLPNNRYSCECVTGYEGANCEITNQCTLNNKTCKNGGLCSNVNNNFTCVCTAGFTGRFCETNVHECDRNLCRNGGTCFNGENGYTCLCKPGYTGTICETQITSCADTPCLNKAICFSTPNSAAGTPYTCLCQEGFEGVYCHIEGDVCSTNPCRNGGTCSLLNDSYKCSCKPGYIGTNCEENINECVNHNCRNGATCLDGINGYTCICPQGLTGTFCEATLADCISSPCKNGGRCVVRAGGGFQCFCKNGYTGLTCAEDFDDCASAPCYNRGICVDLLAGHRCDCLPGTTGLLCETNVDECSSSPCRNGAECIDGVNGYTCICRAGYTGRLCETDVDECASSPCTNGGTCRDKEDMYVCDCPQPYRGINCVHLPCDLNPCESGGTCFNDLSRLPDGFRCECIEGLTGTRCQSNIDDCERQDGTVPCLGRGLCLDDLNKYICLCQPGWKGKDCEVPIDECANNNCRNNATCLNLWNGYRCQCAPGYVGQLCERETDECQPNPCFNGATCVDLHNDFRCVCKEGWTGKRCDTQINECQLTGSNPCRNGGTCVDGMASYTCQCPPFYTGSRCEVYYDPCQPTYNQCLHGAVCLTTADGTYRCTCSTGYTGTNCEIDIDECSSNPCYHGAQCEDRPAGYRCYCPSGYTGTNCQTNIDDCQYCHNGATCQDLLNGYICTCAEGYRGTNCTEDVNECAEFTPCRNGGTCQNIIGGYLCDCKSGYTGRNCETDVDECLSNPCKNNAFCQQGFGIFSCLCQAGFTGRLCETDINECFPHPCGKGTCTDLVNGYRCQCEPGWAGPQCDLDINECNSQPCQNGATCVDGENRYSCICPDGFTGPRCVIDVDVCQNSQFTQCRNGGTCVDRQGASFICRCKPGYEGRFCEIDINECLSAPCLNGGTCQDGINSYNCTCLPGLSGRQCNIDIDECASSPCINGGFCQEKEPGTGYECLCPSGLGGPNCEINYDDCLLGPRCFNGGTCLDGLNNFTCVCPPHATGDVCETLLFIPSSTPIPATTETTTTPSFTMATVSSSQVLSSTFSESQPSTGLVSSETSPTTASLIESSLLLGTSSVTPSLEDNSTSPFGLVSSTKFSTLSSFEPYTSMSPTPSLEPPVSDSSSMGESHNETTNDVSIPVSPYFTTVPDGDGSSTLILHSPVIESTFPTSLIRSSMLTSQDSEVYVSQTTVYPSVEIPDSNRSEFETTLERVTETLPQTSRSLIEARTSFLSDLEQNMSLTRVIPPDLSTDYIQSEDAMFSTETVSFREEDFITHSIDYETLTISSSYAVETLVSDSFMPSVSVIPSEPISSDEQTLTSILETTTAVTPASMASLLDTLLLDSSPVLEKTYLSTEAEEMLTSMMMHSFQKTVSSNIFPTLASDQMFASQELSAITSASSARILSSMFRPESTLQTLSVPSSPPLSDLSTEAPLTEGFQSSEAMLTPLHRTLFPSIDVSQLSTHQPPSVQASSVLSTMLPSDTQMYVSSLSWLETSDANVLKSELFLSTGFVSSETAGTEITSTLSESQSSSQSPESGLSPSFTSSPASIINITDNLRSNLPEATSSVQVPNLSSEMVSDDFLLTGALSSVHFSSTASARNDSDLESSIHILPSVTSTETIESGLDSQISSSFSLESEASNSSMLDSSDGLSSVLVAESISDMSMLQEMILPTELQSTNVPFSGDLSSILSPSIDPLSSLMYATLTQIIPSVSDDSLVGSSSGSYQESSFSEELTTVSPSIIPIEPTVTALLSESLPGISTVTVLLSESLPGISTRFLDSPSSEVMVSASTEDQPKVTLTTSYDINPSPTVPYSDQYTSSPVLPEDSSFSIGQSSLTVDDTASIHPTTFQSFHPTTFESSFEDRDFLSTGIYSELYPSVSDLPFLMETVTLAPDLSESEYITPSFDTLEGLSTGIVSDSQLIELTLTESTNIHNTETVTVTSVSQDLPIEISSTVVEETTLMSSTTKSDSISTTSASVPTSSSSLEPGTSSTLESSPTSITDVTTSLTSSSTASPSSSTPEPRNCFDRPCLNGGTCQTTLVGGQLGYVCHCTQLYTGNRCQISVSFESMEFVGSSLLTFSPVPLLTSNVFSMTFQTTQENGVIFYSAKDYSMTENGYYIRLLVRNGILRYQFSCLLQTFDLDSNLQVNTGQLYNVLLRQNSNCSANMDVRGPTGSSSVEQGMAFMFSTFHLKNLSWFFLGGIPRNVDYIPTAAPNFVGCIRSFYINSQRYSLQEAISRLDVGTCGSTLPTEPPISGSTSTTSTTTSTESTTPMTTTTTGPPQTCRQIICVNGGSCRDVETPNGQRQYQCDCPLRYGGPHCEQEIGISFPRFLGNSYLRHPDLDFSERRTNDLYLSFKTKSREGSLYYSRGPSNDFIHLFISEGFLRYQASCGPTNVLFVDTRVRVDVDILIAVNVQQIQEEDGDCTVTVTINNNLETAVTLTLTPSQGSLSYDLGPLYLGGLPPGVSPTGRASPFNYYVGCIRHLQINSVERLVYQDAVEGLNIQECDVPPCQYQPCHNNATCIMSSDGYTCECLPSYTGVLCERTACDRNPCFHGGTCIHRPQTQGYTCICPYGRHGVNCQEELIITRPQFFGTQLGYMSFLAYPQVSALDLTFDFRFSFTLETEASASNGLLIFAGERAAQSNFGADFFAVGVVENYLHFQFNLGSGMADIRTTSPIDRSRQVHRVRFGRDRQVGYLGLDNQQNVTGSSQGRLMGLNVFSNLYVGGYDNIDTQLPTEISFRQGFKGCIFDLEVRTGSNGQWKKPGSPPGQPETGRNVGQCQQSECQLNQCENRGTCIDLGATFMCECEDGWTGATCRDRVTPCDSLHECTQGSTCLPLANGGYTCQCPLGKAGDLCDKDIKITDARFVGESSYMAFLHKGSLRFAIDIHLQFKPDVQTGLMLYIAEHLSRRSGDFLSVSLREGYIQLRYRVGVDGTIVITSTNSIASGSWHTLAISRNTTHGVVILNGRTTFLKVTDPMVGLDVTTPVFIGGVPDLEAISTSAVENEPSAFEGCIRELIVNRKRYELSEKGATSGINVVDCDGDACGYDVCENGGTCFNRNGGGFVCACTNDYTGANCEIPKACESNECASGATCVPLNLNATYRCICPLGKQGPRCSQDLNFTNPRFIGDSYIRYPDVTHNGSDFTTTFMSLNFSTPVPNGLILWTGQAYSVQDDYLGVGVTGGHVRLVISLGWWTREELVTEEAVSDGRWHSLIISRNKRQLTVYVDGNRYIVNLAGQFSGLNTDGIVYFGGFEPGSRLLDETCGHFPAPFIGCLKDVKISSNTRPINFYEATTGANIQNCTLR